MKTKTFLVPLFASVLALSSCGTTGTVYIVADGSISSWSTPEVVNYMNNYDRQEFFIDGFEATANNTLYLQSEIPESGILTPPSENPSREGYDFDGWFNDAEATDSWDFANDKASTSLFLYSGWTLTGEGGGYVEPEYYPPEHIDDTLDEDLVVTGILNQPVASGAVGLTTADFLRLSNSPNDVRFAINYKRKSGTSIVSASYSEALKKITVTSRLDGIDTERSISVNDISGTLVMSNSTYESKAKAYEEASSGYENDHVMLAGSSSIEFWTGYESMLNPIVSYSHGIGGTTTTNWKDALLDRLVLPYSPKVLVMYAGINDLINSSLDAETVKTNVKDLLDTAHGKLPDTHIIYILLNQLPGYYLDYNDDIADIDSEIVSYCADLDWVETLDAGAGLLKANGEPNAGYFRLDNLHLSEYGYIIWGKAIREAIIGYLG